jgi:hypothetical protein
MRKDSYRHRFRCTHPRRLQEQARSAHRLNAQFDTMNAQYQKDCMLAPVEVIARSQAKCKAERDSDEARGKKFAALQADIAASKH